MAIRAAIEVLHVPSRVRVARAEPLPAGVDLLLRIAAGEAEAEEAAITSTGRSRELIKQAAIFFIEQVLLSLNSDSYRVLGGDAQASNYDLRRNMTLLLKWLHPDKYPQGQREVFASRVTRAWDDLKTPERRAAYDENRRTVSAQKHSTTRGNRGSAASSKRVSPHRRPRRVSVAHIAASQSLLSRALSFLASRGEAMKRVSTTGIADKMSTLLTLKYRSQMVKPILFAVLAAVLVWEVISRTFVAFLANGAPEQALHIRSQYSAALLNLAETKLRTVDENTARPTGELPQELRSEVGYSATFSQNGLRDANGVYADNADRLVVSPANHVEVTDQARHLAEQALLSDPLNARALRILGEIADFSKDEPRSRQFMQASARHSLNETLAVVWLMSKDAERRDYASAMRHADILLRTRPQLGNEVVIPVLARIAENGAAVAALKEMLSQNPPWRAQFFEALPNSITDARTPLDLLMAVKQSSVPPTTQELRSYLHFLVGRKFYALAYYTWLQFLSQDQLNEAGFVYNGGFDAVPSGSPFDWVITSGAGVTIDIDTDPDRDGNRALFVRFEDGRVEFGSVVQLIMLAPAKYRLEATYKGALFGPRGLRWRVTCAGGAPASVGESGMIKETSSAWKAIEFSFVIPNSNCPAQYLHLDLDARMASEQFVSGAVWFDNLQISRVGDAEE